MLKTRAHSITKWFYGKVCTRRHVLIYPWRIFLKLTSRWRTTNLGRPPQTRFWAEKCRQRVGMSIDNKSAQIRVQRAPNVHRIPIPLQNRDEKEPKHAKCMICIKMCILRILRESMKVAFSDIGTWQCLIGSLTLLQNGVQLTAQSDLSKTKRRLWNSASPSHSPWRCLVDPSYSYICWIDLTERRNNFTRWHCGCGPEIRQWLVPA